jgi:hypothetical protein
MAGEVEEDVENLFLLGRFEEAYHVCHSTLEWLAAADCGPSPLHSSTSNKTQSLGSHHFPTASPSSSPSLHTKRPSRVDASPPRPAAAELDRAEQQQMDENSGVGAQSRSYTNGPLGGDAHAAPTHQQQPQAKPPACCGRAGRPGGGRRFHDAEEEAMAMRLVILLIQILFELKRQREVTPFVRWFYGVAPGGPGEHAQRRHQQQLNDVHAIPYQVFLLMCVCTSSSSSSDPSSDVRVLRACVRACCAASDVN